MKINFLEFYVKSLKRSNLIINKILIALVLAVVMSGNTKAETYTPDWELYAETDTEIKYYVDLNSYFQKDGMKYVINMQDTSNQGVDFNSLSFYLEVDCKEVRSRPIKVFSYSGLMGEGEETDLSESRIWDWMYKDEKAPNSPNGILLNYMCGENK